MEQIYWINARDKPAFLVAVMKELSGDESYIEFQGDLSRCDFSDVGGVPVAADVNRRDKGALKVVLALTTGNIKPILKQVLPEARVVHQTNCDDSFLTLLSFEESVRSDSGYSHPLCFNHISGSWPLGMLLQGSGLE